ncbi:MAG TPA: hypothetical protein VMW91_03005 [Desulfosporosinus sp.]|nr:hypothetical protein [Desulfosporosinus sp.]
MNELKEFVPVIATLVGGILTIGGGFMAQLFMQSRTHRRELTKLKREKLEEICALSQAIEDWCGKHLGSLVTIQAKGRDDSPALPRPPMRQLQLLVSFYHAELGEFSTELAKALDSFHKGYAEYAKALIEGSATQELFNDKVNNRCETVRRASRRLLDSACQIACRYV